MTISLRQVVVYDQMMLDVLGSDYTTDKIREAIVARPFGEEVHEVKLLIG
jgi:hypothetical protein